MRPSRVLPALPLFLFLFTSSMTLAAETSSNSDPSAVLHELFSELPTGTAPSGVFYDRVLPLSGIAELDGGVYAPAISLARWRQAFHEIRRAADDASTLPSLNELRSWSRDPEALSKGRASWGTQGEFAGKRIPIAILDYGYDRLREDAFEQGKARVDGRRLHLEDGALESARVFAAAPLVERSYHGSEVEFCIPRDLYFGDLGTAIGVERGPVKFLLDAGDGLGLREIEAGGGLTAHYHAPGLKLLRLSAIYDDGTVRNAAFEFTVKALAAPAPNDTLQLTASIPYGGSAASGEAYLYYAPGRSELVQPIVLVEGFDLDNSLNWDEIYELLNTENLLEDMRAAGYDIVVLNFDDATTEIQRNSLLVVELLQQVQQRIDPRAQFTLAGASMGGLCTRYALAYMEQNALAHRVNTWISFDAPHGGANIPLGLQYWLDFFSGQSADAAFLLERLDRPAARQLLVYHHLAAAGGADPLRADFLADLVSLGGYPDQPRRVAIANGSGSGQTQGFAPGQQIIRWEYDNIITAITGNVWAVGDGPNTRVFDGSIKILFIPIDDQEVFVAGTNPYDSAPGGSRASMQQAGDTEAPYGDILALHPSHCFIPTISALALDTDDLFYDVDGDADLLALSPFDALYFPPVNEEHVQVTAQNAQWIKDELFGSPTAREPARPARPLAVLHQNVPNPFNPRTTLRYELGVAGPVRLDLYDVRGRHLRTLVDGPVEAGEYRVEWDGRDGSGRSVASGMYFARFEAGGQVDTRRMILAR